MNSRGGRRQTRLVGANTLSELIGMKKNPTKNISSELWFGKESKHHSRQRDMLLEEQSFIERSKIRSSKSKSKTPKKNPGRLIQAAITSMCHTYRCEYTQLYIFTLRQNNQGTENNKKTTLEREIFVFLKHLDLKEHLQDRSINAKKRKIKSRKHFHAWQGQNLDLYFIANGYSQYSSN